MQTEQIDKKAEEKIVAMSSDVSSLQNKMPSEKIKTDEQYNEAGQLLTIVVGRLKRAKEAKDEVIKPFKDHIKRLEGKFKENWKPYEDMEKELRSFMGDYIRELREKEAEKERKKQEAVAKKNAEAQKNGKEIDATPVSVERKDLSVESSEGKTSTRKKWVAEVVDVHSLPLKYRKEILEAAANKGIAKSVVQKHVDAGEREIKGANIYEDYQVTVRA